MAEFVRFVYPKISTVDVSSQTVSRIYSQPKVLFVYPISSTGTNIRPISTNNVNQQVIDENQFGMIDGSVVNGVIFNENMLNNIIQTYKLIYLK